MVPSSISAGINVRCGVSVEWLVVSTSASEVLGPVMSPMLAIVVKASGLAELSTCNLVPMAAMPVGGGASIGKMDGGIPPPGVANGFMDAPAARAVNPGYPGCPG